MSALAALFGAALLPGCKSVDMPSVPGVTPYRMVIQQGNFISQEMVAQLKPGMTKEQVRFVLGTPLVTDIFHADRWDYVFYREPPGGKREQRNLSVIFEKDRLARVIGDLMPSEGQAPQAGGFDSQFKPSAKPAAEPPKPAAEPAKPAAEAAPPPPTGQNWNTASDAPEKKPEATPPASAEEAKKPEESKPAEEQKVEEPKEERGWFGRMLEKIGL
ncbi:MAG TPA: outer membrane protein assembly factor BamE [Burkholderiales bacterium]|nr:outer membrane protein assembly factor BamE [Burkholderiales bacterium]